MLYSILKTILYFYYKVIYFSSAEGLENIPSDGSMIICGNHKHFNDPLIITSYFKKNPVFLAKKELFQYKFTNWF
ncbi:MAG: 1-acyl-sn-glycerol-3-phosphate acyltransferase, partial [Clostridia bacterium]|nr:1-acyl-sn-glycerol-3-phosphate acyltransferase [Clostridia bacterium]